MGVNSISAAPWEHGGLSGLQWGGGSMAPGNGLHGCSGKAMATEGAVALAVICREILGQEETSSPWEGVWHGCSLSPAAIASGEGQALRSQPGKGGGC